MTSSKTPRIYIHPDARHTVLPYLIPHLPSSLNQEYLIVHPPSPSSLVLASIAPDATISPDDTSEPWSVAILDLSRPNEVELWFWCSAEFDPPSFQSEPESYTIDPLVEKARFARAYPLLHSTLAFVAHLHPTKEVLSVGSLNKHFAPHIPPEVLQRHSEPYVKLIFTPENVVPAATAYDAHYDWGTLEAEELEEVVSTSAVKRVVATLAKLSNTGAYPRSSSEASGPDAWCFTTIEGSIGSLYVRPEVRRSGLGKAVMRVELMKCFEGVGVPAEKDTTDKRWKRKYVSVDVAEDNTPSLKVCEGLGARSWRDWKCVWLGFYLDRFRESETETVGY